VIDAPRSVLRLPGLCGGSGAEMVRYLVLSAARAVVRFLDPEPFAVGAVAGHAVNEWRWRTAILVWCMWAERVAPVKLSFVASVRAIKMASGGLLEVRDVTAVTDVLARAGVVVKVERARVRWAGAWNIKQLRRKVRLGQVSLPFPDFGPPVAFLPFETETDETETARFRSDFN